MRRTDIRRWAIEQLENRTVPSVVINELYVNPPGTDDNREFVELRSLNGGPVTLPNLALVEIQGNPNFAGVIGTDVHMSGLVTGANGLALLGENYGNNGTPWGTEVTTGTVLGDMNGHLGNDNFTLFLVEGYSGISGQDLDTNDDGILDVTPWTNVLDSVGWYDPSISGGKVYTTVVLTQTQNTPDAASRFSNRMWPQSAGAWYNGEMLLTGGTPDMTHDYDPTKASVNLPANAKITPGAGNFLAPGPSQVTGIVINGGNGQRSRVSSLAVSFDQIVTASSTAFQLIRQADGASIGVTAVLDNSMGHTVADLSFTGELVIGGSLPDGLFTLSIQASQVTNSFGPIDGNGDGVGGDNYQLVGTATNRLFRLFGDSDGNGIVNSSDFAAFRSSFGLGASNFDFDGDGQTNSNDFAEFRKRFGISLAP